MDVNVKYPEAQELTFGQFLNFFARDTDSNEWKHGKSSQSIRRIFKFTK